MSDTGEKWQNQNQNTENIIFEDMCHKLPF